MKRCTIDLAGLCRPDEQVNSILGHPLIVHTRIIGRPLRSHKPTALRDKYELVYRRRAEHPNAMWQADHTELDILILDDRGAPVRPWLSIVLDDHSRAVAACSAFAGAPSALNTSLTLRHAIWRKSDPVAWPVSGIPDVLCVDHGSDFISHHLTQVAVDLHVQLIHFTVGRPHGRDKIERLFGTITTELDQALTRWVVEDYHRRVHPEIGQTPNAAWVGQGWLPRMPDTLEDLDLLLVMVATPRTVHRDGIRFQGLRYLSPTLAPYVKDKVTIRYDPRDLARSASFTATGSCVEPSATPTPARASPIADIKTARTARRRELRAGLNTRVAAAGQYSRTEPNASPAGPATPIDTEAGPLPRGQDVSDRFIATKQHRRFVEFADTIKRNATIGLCYGPAGVGKTLSARRYSHWDDVAEHFDDPWQHAWDNQTINAALHRSRSVFYTPTVADTPRLVAAEILDLLGKADDAIDEHSHRDDPPPRIIKGPHHRLVQLLVVDEAERLNPTALEHLRDRHDREHIGSSSSACPASNAAFPATPSCTAASDSPTTTPH